jgi:segregation and condensation protein B
MMDTTEPPSAECLAEARRAVEAIVLVATDPIPSQLLAQLLELPVEVVGQLCDGLARSYAEAGHGFQLVQVGGGWRYQTDPDLAPYVERFALDGQSTRMSSAALETLAIVAYKQPISRAQISAIRGVNVDGVLRTLAQRGYVEEVGRDTGAGQAVLFGTTSYFLERVGLNGLDQLPALGDFVPSAQVVEALEQTLRVEAGPVEVVTDAETGAGSNGDGNGGGNGSGATDAETGAGSNGDGSGNGDGAADRDPAAGTDRDPLDLRQVDAGTRSPIDERALDGMAIHPAGTGDAPVSHQAGEALDPERSVVDREAPDRHDGVDLVDDQVIDCRDDDQAIDLRDGAGDDTPSSDPSAPG